MKKIGKQQQIQDHIAKYNGHVITCLDEFQKTFNQCCGDYSRDTLEENYQVVHRAEGKADDIRRSLETMMYSKAVFPESRGDILGLIESMDRVPNQAESAVRMMLIQYIELPQKLCGGIIELVNVCTSCVHTMVEGVNQLFDNYLEASSTAGKIDELESEADHLEEKLIKWVFTHDLSDLQKLLLRDLIRAISSVADRAENVGDRIRIMVAKRSV